MLTSESRRIAGILLVVLPTVIYGGVSLLTFLIDQQSGYMGNPLRQNLFRAGHAHAGVLLVLSLVALRYVDEAQLSAEAIRALGHSVSRHISSGGFSSPYCRRPQLSRTGSSTSHSLARLYWRQHWSCSA